MSSAARTIASTVFQLDELLSHCVQSYFPSTHLGVVQLYCAPQLPASSHCLSLHEPGVGYDEHVVDVVPPCPAIVFGVHVKEQLDELTAFGV